MLIRAILTHVPFQDFYLIFSGKKYRLFSNIYMKKIFSNTILSPLEYLFINLQIVIESDEFLRANII